MNNVPLILRHGVQLATLGLLIACSGTQAEGDPDSTPSGEGTTPAPIAGGAQGPQTTPPQVRQQRNEQLIAQALENARRALNLNLWEEALTESAFVLDLDSENDEARSIFQAAQSRLDPTRAGARTPVDQITQSRIALERSRSRARQSEATGEALELDGRFGDAIEEYSTAILILENNPFISAGDDDIRRLQSKRDGARQRQVEAMQDQRQAQLAASEQQREDAERLRQLSVQARVRRLLEQANNDFQLGNFSATIASLDQVLAADPNNGHARDLHELASRAAHENRIEVLRQRWKAEWSETFDRLNTANVPQTDVLKFDTARWAIVSQREPLTFTAPDDVDTPEERAILSKLRDTKVEHRFATASIDDWKGYYARITETNFIVATDVTDLGEDATMLTDFSLPTMSVEQALNIIGDQLGLKWHVRSGVVEIVTADAAIGKTYLVPYDVRDLVLGVSNKPGPELKLRVPGEEPESFLDEDEPAPTVVDDSRLQELISGNILPDSWGEVGSIGYQNGVLLINHTKEVHNQVQQLLSDLRQAVGVQVDIEARFLQVDDSFLEDIGVDFRGLGNQAAEGVPGRGLGARQNLRFDDFGTPQEINPASPGTIGTGAEPGIFYDDGLDGDLIARTEHLFDRTLGSPEDGITNAGGLSIQHAFLDDTELEVVLRAVSKQERTEEIVAPRLLVYNNTRASMQALRHTSYIKDFDVEIAQAAAVANPVVDVVRDGVVLDVRPVVSADRRFITMELRPTIMNLILPIPTFTTTLGAGQPVSIQLPNVQLQRVRTTVTMPDGSTVMLGGMKLAERQKQVAGVPILMDIPLLGFFFSRKGTFIRNRKILILIRANIIISEEHQPIVPSDAYLPGSMPR